MLLLWIHRLYGTLPNFEPVAHNMQTEDHDLEPQQKRSNSCPLAFWGPDHLVPTVLKAPLSSNVWPAKSEAGTRPPISLQVSEVQSRYSSLAVGVDPKASQQQPEAVSRAVLQPMSSAELTQNQAILRHMMQAALKAAKQPGGAAAAGQQVRVLMQQAAMLQQLRSQSSSGDTASAEALTRAPSETVSSASAPLPLFRSSDTTNAVPLLSSSASGCLSDVPPEGMPAAETQPSFQESSRPAGPNAEKTGHSDAVWGEDSSLLCRERSIGTSPAAASFTYVWPTVVPTGLRLARGLLPPSPRLAAHHHLGNCAVTEQEGSFGSPTARLQKWSRGWERHAEWWKACPQLPASYE